MTWWAWTAVWLLVISVTVGVFFLVGRSLWRKAAALLRELGTATERLSAVSEELRALEAVTARTAEPDVFTDPATLRQQQALTGRERTTRPHGAGRTTQRSR